MMLKAFKRQKYVQISVGETPRDAENRPFERCPQCKEILLLTELEDNLRVCSRCGHHFRLGAGERIKQLIDEGTFQELDPSLGTEDPLNFPDYQDKLRQAKNSTGLQEAIVSGLGEVQGVKIVIAVMDATFMMGSMGSVVGEKLARAMELALVERLPLVVITASGGARMQEGVISLLQMAKTASLVSQLDREGVPYITILTDPTTGGTLASFASLGDIIIAEPGALIGFAGPRVIEQITKQKLPEGFQRAEFLLEKGFVDLIVSRHELKATLAKLLGLHLKEA